MNNPGSTKNWARGPGAPIGYTLRFANKMSRTGQTEVQSKPVVALSERFSVSYSIYNNEGLVANLINNLSIYLSIYLSVCLSIYLSIDLSIYLSIYLSISVLLSPVISGLSDSDSWLLTFTVIHYDNYPLYPLWQLPSIPIMTVTHYDSYPLYPLWQLPTMSCDYEYLHSIFTWKTLEWRLKFHYKYTKKRISEL